VAGNLTARFDSARCRRAGTEGQLEPAARVAGGLALAKRKQLAVRNAVLGVSWFWFTGTLLTSQLPVYAELHLGGLSDSAALYVFALALFSVGVGVGSLLCEKLSARTVEIGLVPLGALGMSAFLLDLYFARPGGGARRAGWSWPRSCSSPAAWGRLIADLAGHRPVHRHLRGAAVRADPEPHPRSCRA
jgi:hypothetical protein